MGIKLFLIRFLSVAFAVLTPILSHAATEGHALNWTEFYYRILVFVIFVALLIYFLRKPILKLLTGKKTAVETAINTANKAYSDAEELLESYKSKMSSLETELQEMRRESLKLAEADGKMMIEDAHAAAEKMKQQATTMIETKLVKAKDDLRNEVTLLALEQAKKAVIKDAKGAKGKKIMDSYIKRIGA